MDIIIPIIFMSPYVPPKSRRSIFCKPKERKSRVFKPRANFKIFTDEELIQMCRLNKEALCKLYIALKPKINRHTGQTNSIPGPLKLIAVLHYLATGSFQHSIAARYGFSQPTLSKTIKQVVQALVDGALDYIKFPYAAEDQIAYMEEFYTRYGFPNVLALIDCTHVAIIPPSNTEAVYRNRKLYHSINVQVAAGPWLNIIDVVAKFPGSTHDSFILENSELARELNSGHYKNAVLLGDNGYSLKKWLLTPYLHPQTPGEMRFNYAHRETRSQIERMFGLLKSRFRCLDISGGALLYKPESVCKIIVACCVLHNIAMQHKVPIILAEDLREHIEFQGDSHRVSANEGQLVRQHITRNFFD